MKTDGEATYKRTLKRVMYELSQAIQEDRAHTALQDCQTLHGTDFFRIAFDALNNDTVAHAMKVLDRHPQSRGFWYIYKFRQEQIDVFCNSIHSISFTEIELLSDKLKSIRDRTHFHIDHRSIFNPEKVWAEADIKSADFSKILENLWKIVNHFYAKEYGCEWSKIAYDGSNVSLILDAVHTADILPIRFNRQS